MADPIPPKPPNPPAGDPPPPNPPAPPPPPGKTSEERLAELEKITQEQARHIESLNRENAEKRHENKALRQIETALKTAFGLDGDPAAVAARVTAHQQQEEQGRKSELLFSYAMAEAAKVGAVDPEAVARLLDTRDVSVELATRTVDRKVLGERITAMKTERPYLFQRQGDPPPPAPPAPPAPPSPSPAPPRPPAGGNGGGHAGEQYMRLLAEGKKAEAQALYLANRQVVGEYIRQHGGNT